MIKKIHKYTYSEESIYWLDFIVYKEIINIRHALNGREKKYQAIKLTGIVKKQKLLISFMVVFGTGVLNVLILIE